LRTVDPTDVSDQDGSRFIEAQRDVAQTITAATSETVRRMRRNVIQPR
jgi:hypothetical protein